jgi:hypothetical protein
MTSHNVHLLNLEFLEPKVKPILRSQELRRNKNVFVGARYKHTRIQGVQIGPYIAEGWV